MSVATWNVQTLLDLEMSSKPERRTALVAKELARYRVDIAALSETRLSGEDQLTEKGAGYTFFGKVSLRVREENGELDLQSKLIS